MVLLDPGSFDQAYDRIKTDALKGDSTVQIFIAPDVDSLCAGQILAALLQSDFIRYTQMPAADLVDLHDQRDALTAAPGDVQSIILINAGGNVDLLEEFQALDEQPLAHLTFYVIDSHRPMHLANVFDDGRVYMFSDGNTKIPDMEDVIYDSDEDEGLDGDDDDDAERDAFAEDAVDEDGQPVTPKSKRRRTDGRLSPRSRRERRQEVEMNQDDYYRASSYGISAAVLMWHLASDLGKEDNALLWHAIVGLTDQFLHDRIDVTTYTLQVDQLSSDVSRMNRDDQEAEGQAMDRIEIKAKEELRLMLLRQWTVFEAMLHSRYVATRIGSWRQKGKQTIRNMLAKMGMPLEQCNQKYTSMELESRGRLEDQMVEYSDDYKLEQIIFPSFISQASYRLQYSASDVVFSTVGLLEANSPREGEPVDWKANFYRAYDALGMKKPELLSSGMVLCQKQHGAILRQVESVIEGTNGIRTTGAFRYVTIKDHPDQQYFVHHAVLQKLGLYLMDTFRFNPQNKRKALPLVLCAQNPETEEYIVVGIWNTPSRAEGKVVPNAFGKFFEEATIAAKSRAKLTGFDTIIMQIKSDDLMQFLRQLTQTIKQATQGRR